MQLDGRGRIVAANDRARDVIRTGEGLFDEDGFLHARSAEDDAQLQAVLARALPPFGVQGAAGSTMVSRSFPQPPLALHVNPVGRPETDLRVWPVAALVLVADPASRTRIDPAVAEEALGLTGMESRVAVLLAEEPPQDWGRALRPMLLKSIVCVEVSSICFSAPLRARRETGGRGPSVLQHARTVVPS